MDFSLTEEQELLLTSIRELITTNFPEEYFRTCDQNGTYPREFMRALVDNGISMLGVPEEFGGIPADYVTQMLALMEVSKCGAPAFLITNGQCIHSMRRFGSAEQLRKTAESTLETGDPAYAPALTEPGAGSDNNSATTTYTRKKRQGLHQLPENLYYRCERVPVYAGAGARSRTERSEKGLHPVVGRLQ